ncbi:MAG: Bug family tripartite tricarboxylate transporter substrate binding protein [Rhodospirillaceae bacterium]
MKAIVGIALSMLASGVSTASAAEADRYPSRPVRYVVPSTPGGGLDVLARITAPRMTAKWGQQVVVDNRAGAGGIIGTEIVAKAPPDGHTLLIVTTGFASNPFLHKSLPYKTPDDFIPITIVGSAPNVLVVHPSLAVKSVAELIALAKQKPGQLAFASSGLGSGGQLSMALLETMAKIKFIHVPYKGAGAATAAVLAGEAQLLFTATGASVPHIRSGRIRAIAVSSAKRVSVLPDVPSVAESGLPGYDVDGWYGIMAPAGTPKAIIDKIYRDVLAIIKTPEVAQQIQTAGFEVGGMPPDEFRDYIKNEINKWGVVIKEAGIKGE